MQRRIDAQKALVTPAPAPIAAPIFNFSIGKEIVKLFHPHMPAHMPLSPTSTIPQPQAQPLVQAAVPPIYDLQCPTVLQPSRKPGNDMPISEFCVQYELGKEVEAKFSEHSYSHARMLRFVTILELKEMGFRLGEVAALWDAVDRWSASIF